MGKLRLTAADCIIMAVLLLIGGVGIWWNLTRGLPTTQKYLAVFVDNEKVAELSLAPEDCFSYSFPFARGQHQAVLEIDGGRVRMQQLPEELCPRGICAHTGWISRPYESIVCLPNRIMIVFSKVPPGEAGDLDCITY